MSSENSGVNVIPANSNCNNNQPIIIQPNDGSQSATTNNAIQQNLNNINSSDNISGMSQTGGNKKIFEINLKGVKYIINSKDEEEAIKYFIKNIKYKNDNIVEIYEKKKNNKKKNLYIIRDTKRKSFKKINS